MDSAPRQAIQAAMIRFADGDRAAIDVLLELLWPVILSFARRGVAQVADAEDVAQEVFVKICARSADFDRKQDAVSWAFGIASYEVMTHRKRVKRRREIPGDAIAATMVDVRSSQEDVLLRSEIASALQEAVGALAEYDRRALGLPAGESTSDGGATARKRKQRALGRLRSIWRSIYGDP